MGVELIQDESELVAGLQMGDPGAFKLLVLKYGDELRSFSRRMLGNEAEAEEVVQEAFLGVFRCIKDFRGESEFRTWLYRIASNASLRVFRQRTKDKILREVDPDGFSPSYGLWGLRSDVLLERIEDDNSLMRGFKTLPDHYRGVLSLRYIDDHKVQDVVRILGLTETNVKIRIHRACAMLRRKVRRIRKAV